MNIQVLYHQRASEPSDINEHLDFMYAQVCRFPGAVVIELGTRTGVSTAALLAAVETVEGHLWSVDVETLALEPSILNHPRFTLVTDDDLHAAASLPDCDVLFVDTSHHYLHTTAELAVWMPKVRRVAMFHDTTVEQPYGAPLGDPPFPVARALDEWCAANEEFWTNHAWCNGLGTIEVNRPQTAQPLRRQRRDSPVNQPPSQLHTRTTRSDWPRS